MPAPSPTAYRFSGARFRKIREAHGLSRELLAVRIPCSMATITRAELDYHVPGAERLAAFAAGLGVRMEDFFVPTGVDVEVEA